MTSLDEHTGRPGVAPWLRGWIDEDPPRTSVAWRSFLPLRDNGPTDPVRELLQAAPLQSSELLETETHRIVDWLRQARRSSSRSDEDPPIGVLLDNGGELLQALTVADIGRSRNQLQRRLAGRTLVVRASWGGLSPTGLLDAKHETAPRVLDQYVPEDPWLEGLEPPFRIREEQESEEESRRADGIDWIEVRRIPLEDDSGHEDAGFHSFVVERRPTTTTDEESRSSGNPQRLAAHQAEAADHAGRLADRLDLDAGCRNLLVLAARLHDEGKRAVRWQRAFHAPPGGDWAKTRGPVDVGRLEGYRHELGSYLRVLEHPELRALSEAERDLVLHLIASHHGFARPVIPTSGCDDAPPSVLRHHSVEITERFIRLQRELGPWQLAWWETILRAADQQASRANDARRLEHRIQEVQTR